MTTLVTDLLRDRAVAEPARVAHQVDGAAALTYGDWERRSNALARGLVDMDVRPGDRLGLYFENPEWVDFAVAYMGVIKAGAVAVPLSSRFAPPELLSATDKAGVNGVITGGATPRVPGWHLTAGELEKRFSVEPLAVEARPDDLVEVLYTSGTTGVPKGVACTHAHIVQPLMDPDGWPPPRWSECAGGVYLHALAVSTAGGQLRLFEPLGPQRMTVITLPVFDPQRFCRLAADKAASVVQLVPAMALAIVQTGAGSAHDLSPVRVVELGCAPLPPSVLPELSRAFPNALLINVYGLSEARYLGTAMVHDGTRPSSVGLPVRGSEVQVTHSSGHPVAPGALGEVRLGRPGLAPQHYFEDAEATAEVFSGGWTRTGDAGYLDEDGYLHIVDRINDVIIRGGFNVSSVVVESALLEHPAVAEAAVLGVPDPLHGEGVAAAVVLRAPADPDELREFVQTRLAAHEVPARIAMLAELPRNRSGKVLRRQLRNQLTQPAQSEPARATGSISDTLAAIWEGVLCRSDVGPDGDFFDLGGDSLLAAMVATRIKALLGVEVAVTVVFEHRTLAELSALVTELRSSGPIAYPTVIPRLPRPELMPAPGINE